MVKRLINSVKKVILSFSISNTMLKFKNITFRPRNLLIAYNFRCIKNTSKIANKVKLYIYNKYLINSISDFLLPWQYFLTQQGSSWRPNLCECSCASPSMTCRDKPKKKFIKQFILRQFYQYRHLILKVWSNFIPYDSGSQTRGRESRPFWVSPNFK